MRTGVLIGVVLVLAASAAWLFRKPQSQPQHTLAASDLQSEAPPTTAQPATPPETATTTAQPAAVQSTTEAQIVAPEEASARPLHTQPKSKAVPIGTDTAPRTDSASATDSVSATTSAPVVGRSSTAAASASYTPVQQAHYQLELLYTSFAQNEPGAYKLSGALAGFSLGGEYDMRRSRGMILWGIDYFTGTPSSDTTNFSGATTSATADTDFYTFGLAYGRRQELGSTKFAVQESLGADYRYFESKARGGKTAQQELIWLYIPLTVGVTWQMADRWQLRATAEEDVIASGTSRQHLENINPNMPTLSLSENSGTGTKLSLGARKKGQELDLTGEVFYRNWQIAESSTENYLDSKRRDHVGVTPANSTDMLGLGIGVTY